MAHKTTGGRDAKKAARAACAMSDNGMGGEREEDAQLKKETRA